jgi:predicted DNA-binding transcriptional regulator YafY
VGVIDAIRQAAREHKLLKIQYRKLDATISERVVEPYEIKGGTRFFAHDIAKDEIRQFIITGILTAQVLEEVFDPRWPIKIA